LRGVIGALRRGLFRQVQWKANKGEATDLWKWRGGGMPAPVSAMVGFTLSLPKFTASTVMGIAFRSLKTRLRMTNSRSLGSAIQEPSMRRSYALCPPAPT
jgi:hypothetical protein